MKILKLCFLILCASFISSCWNLITDNPFDEDDLISTYTCPLLFNLNGDKEYIFPPNQNYNQGNIQFFNDNLYFCIYNEKLHIFNSEDHELVFSFEDITTDYNYDDYFFRHSERAGISYDDSLIAYTSSRNLYYLKMDTKEIFQLTDSESDYCPSFSLEKKIFFCRKDSIDLDYKLMSINKDGTELEEHYTFDERLTRIIPGQVDKNTVFIVKNNSNFYKYNNQNNSCTCLCDLPEYRGMIVDRSNNDNLFSFCRHNYDNNYVYNVLDQQLHYININNRHGLSKIMPNGESLFVFDSYNERILFLDLNTNEIINEFSMNFIVNSGSTGSLDISTNSNKVITLAEVYYD